MKLGERFSQSYERIEKPVKELLGRMSPSQRWSLVILGAAVLLMLGMIVSFGPENDRTFRIPVGQERLIVRDLEANDIPFEIEEGSAVVAYEYRARVESLFVENPDYQRDPDLWKWLYGQTSWNESSGQRRDKILDTKRRRVEAALEAIPAVASATVNVNSNHNSRFVQGESPSTASVLLEPAEGKIPPRLAHGIQKYVAFAFGLKTQNVTLMDHRGPLAMEDSLDLLDDTKKAQEEELRRKITGTLARIYTANAFTVEVDISLDREDEESSSISYEPQLTSGVTRERSETDESQAQQQAPGTKPNTASLVQPSAGVQTTTNREYSETEYENFASSTSKKIKSPSGDIERVSIYVCLSHEAVIQQINLLKGVELDAKPTSDEIDAKVKEIEDDVRSFPAVPPDRINARVRTVVMTPDIRSADTDEATGMLGFVQIHVKEIVLGVLALVGCILLYRVASRAAPELEALPDPVADLQQFLRDKEERDRVRAEQLHAELSDQKREIDWETSEEDRVAIDLLESVTQFATERPDLAATVLRSWMSEPSKNEKPKSVEEV
ncbi:MAG: hypothetical protein KDC38_14715 [Planctomycetes bacterium]|nr:hypothetical protein [Planctomycetota bacterium]